MKKGGTAMLDEKQSRRQFFGASTGLTAAAAAALAEPGKAMSPFIEAMRGVFPIG